MAKSRETYRKVITSEELTAQINPENKKLVDRYMKNFATKRSPKTVKVYESNLNIFFTWNLLENDNAFFIDLKKLHYMDFFDYCVTELKWNSARYANMHSTLSSFSSWIENYFDDEYPQFRNLLPKIEKPIKESVREKTVLQKEDIDKIMSKLESENKIQEQCLLALAISCGARVAELARFTTDLIDEENTVFDGLFLETTKAIPTKGRGVNGKMLKKYILKDTFLYYYQKWLIERKQILEETGQEHNYIFVTRDGNPASDDRLRDWINGWSDIVDKPCYPHSLRHRNITSMRELGIEDDLIVYLTGWAEGSGHSMIAIYDDTELKSKQWKSLDKLKNALAENKI